MIQTKNISFSYNDQQSFSFPDFLCEGGDSCLILGKSGVGKTTLLHILGGMLRPDKGTVYVNDTSVSELTGTQLDHYRGRNIGIVFQKPHFIASISILENLMLTRKLAGGKTNRKEILDLLESLEISHRAHAKPSMLSQGELQRASVARAVLNNPKVLLADEPTSALDDESCYQVIDLLQKTSKKVGAALVIVTHDGRLKDIIDHQIVLS